MDNSRYYKRTIMKEELVSSFLEESRGMKIFLPPGYDERISYPTLYCQDGDDFYAMGRVATHATRLILDEGMPPMIIVGVEVDKSNRTAEYAPEGERFHAYCEFFSKELVPYIDQHYPTRRDVDERVLAGDSLGGTVSLHLAMDHPELFRKVISLSGAFLPSTQTRLMQEKDLSRLELYMIIGEDEMTVKTERGTFDFLSYHRVACTLLQEKKAVLSSAEKPGTHTWGLWQNELPAALQHFFH